MTDTESSKMYEYRVSKEHTNKFEDDTISIYSNDLKYRKYNDINLKNVKNLDTNIDYDTVDYRIKECLDSGGKTLDLSHLNLTKLPKLPEKIIQNVKYLFLAENKLNEIDDLSHFNKLSVVDLCNNTLTKIPTMPFKLKELLIKYNSINNITNLNECYYLRRLDCSHNEIVEIPYIKSLEILICDYNKIHNLKSFDHLIKLSCSHNVIQELPSLPNIEIVECDRNQITKIENYPLLRELYCSCNKIAKLTNIQKIDTLHCYKNNIKNIDYFDNLKHLVCDYADIDLSSHYTIIESVIYKNKIISIYFK